MNGFRMRELRKIARLRQVEVAPELGVNYRTIWRWEKENVELTKVQSEAAERLFSDIERMDVIRKARKSVQRAAFVEKRKKNLKNQPQGDYEP